MAHLNGLREQIEFDLTKPTARDLKDILPLVVQGKMGAVQELMRFIVVKCPESWGLPGDASTYTRLNLFGDEFAALWALYKAASDESKDKLLYATFDLSDMTGPQFDDEMDAINKSDVTGQARILAKHVKKCDVLSAVDDAEAYLDLKYYTQFRPLLTKFQEAGKDAMENFLNRFTV